VEGSDSALIRGTVGTQEIHEDLSHYSRYAPPALLLLEPMCSVLKQRHLTPRYKVVYGSGARSPHNLKLATILR
jgi:hypothetical protein